MMRTPTIRDVAKEAGVGIGTASRALNGAPRVSAKTRQLVLEAAERLGYQPNLAARQLSGSKMYAIGVLTPFFTNPSFVRRLAGIQTALDESEYDLILYSVKNAEQLQRQLDLLSNQKRVDGLITISFHIEPEVLERINQKIRVITVDDEHSDNNIAVFIDNTVGGFLATDYLIQKGHRNIGFIGDEQDLEFGFSTTQHRFSGYKDALQRKGLPLNPDWHRFGRHSLEVARQHALEMLSGFSRPSAIFADADTKAMGVIAAARELGMRVPEDIAVIGFDDIEVAGFTGLTTVRQSLYESGHLGATLLLQQLGTDQPADRFHRQLPLEVMERLTV